MTERDRLNRRLTVIRNVALVSALFFAGVSIWRDSHHGLLICVDLAFTLAGAVAVLYLCWPLPASDRERAERHIRSLPDAYLEDAMRRTVDRLMRDAAKDGRLK